MALDTGAKITRFQWTELPMPKAVIDRVNQIGENKPSILTFTNRHGKEIGDTTQDFNLEKDDDEPLTDETTVVKQTDETTGVEQINDQPTDMDLDGDLQEWTSMPSPQEWRLKLTMVKYMKQLPKNKRTMDSANKSPHQRYPMSLLPCNVQAV